MNNPGYHLAVFALHRYYIPITPEGNQFILQVAPVAIRADKLVQFAPGPGCKGSYFLPDIGQLRAGAVLDLRRVVDTLHDPAHDVLEVADALQQSVNYRKLIAWHLLFHGLEEVPQVSGGLKGINDLQQFRGFDD